MINKKPEVIIRSKHSYNLGDDNPFELTVLVNQLDSTNVNFPFLPFDVNGSLKKVHPIHMSSEERQVSCREALFHAATFEEIKEKEAEIFQEVKMLLNSWLSYIDGAMEWESTHMEYDSSIIVDETPNEKTE